MKFSTELFSSIFVFFNSRISISCFLWSLGPWRQDWSLSPLEKASVLNLWVGLVLESKVVGLEPESARAGLDPVPLGDGQVPGTPGVNLVTGSLEASMALCWPSLESGV